MPTHQVRAYPFVLVALLSLNFGVVFFDRNSINYLMPFIQPQLQLSNTQIGLLASVLSFSWALAGLCIGRLSDALRKRKALLVACALVFSAASLLSGWAASFAMLMGPV
jgi:MFS transporter, ACS family, hexuronate transporter